jgi:hypothetical protein
MYDCVYMNPRYLNILMHEFMSRWNTKARIRNLGYAGFGTFQLELLDRLDILVSSYLGSWIPFHPLRLGDVVYKRLPANSNPKQTFGMTPLFEATAATVRKAMSSGGADGAVVILAGDEDGDGNVQGGVILGASDPVLPDPGLSLENEDDAEAEHHDTSMQNEDPVPLTTPEELNLFLQLHAAMIHPNNTNDKALPVDFILLTEQFNMQVVKRRTDDPTLASVLKLKTPSLIHKAYDMAAESFRATEVVGPKLETLKKLRHMLKSNTGFVFPEIKSRDNPTPAVQIPVPNNAVLGVPVVVPAAALDVAAEAPVIAQNLPTSINLQKYTLPSNVSSSQLQQLITERLEIIDNTRWCPLCKKRAQIFSDGQWELSNNLHKEIGNKGGRRGLYPTCNECDDRAPNVAEKKTEQDRKRKEKKKLKELVTKQGKGKNKKSESSAGSTNPGKSKKRKKGNL